MRNKTRLAVVFGMAAWMAGGCLAQGEGKAEASKYYHLDFVVQEVDGDKVTNSRHYLTTIATGDGSPSVIRTGSKVPITTGGAGQEGGQLTYLDVGVNMDCRMAKEVGGDLALNVSAEISSAATMSRQPLIRQTKWAASVIVPLGKPTVIFSSDDVAAKGKIQLELTATAVK